MKASKEGDVECNQSWGKSLGRRTWLSLCSLPDDKKAVALPINGTICVLYR